jgi:sugar lactone lactonase YvrE
MGVDFDAYGNMYVSDFSQGKIMRIDPRLRLQTIAEFLTTPAGLAIDRKNHLILVPYLTGNVAEINGLGRDRR